MDVPNFYYYQSTPWARFLIKIWPDNRLQQEDNNRRRNLKIATAVNLVINEVEVPAFMWKIINMRT